MPLILSTGMATYGEIEDALGAVAEAGQREVALLRCASLYPAPPEIMNLRAMGTMRDAFGVPVGLSDHTRGSPSPTGAAALGAELVEKHFTLDRAMEGPDHPFALEPDELTALVAGVRAVEAALGDGRLEGPSRRWRPARCTRSPAAQRDRRRGHPRRHRDHRGDAHRQAPGLRRPAQAHRRCWSGGGRSVDIEFDESITWEMV